MRLRQFFTPAFALEKQPGCARAKPGLCIVQESGKGGEGPCRNKVNSLRRKSLDPTVLDTDRQLKLSSHIQQKCALLADRLDERHRSAGRLGVATQHQAGKSGTGTEVDDRRTLPHHRDQLGRIEDVARPDLVHFPRPDEVNFLPPILK